MPMYRFLIYFVVALLIGGAGYYFRSAGVPDLIIKDIKNGDGRGNGVSALEVFSGIYVCEESSGCQKATKIILQQDTTVDIIATEEGQDISLGQGTWGIGGNGSLVIIVSPQLGPEGPYPSKLIANKISTIKLSGFSNKVKLYPWMDDPSFLRVEDPTGSTVAN